MVIVETEAKCLDEALRYRPRARVGRFLERQRQRNLTAEDLRALMEASRGLSRARSLLQGVWDDLVSPDQWPDGGPDIIAMMDQRTAKWFGLLVTIGALPDVCLSTANE